MADQWYTVPVTILADVQVLASSKSQAKEIGEGKAEQIIRKPYEELGSSFMFKDVKAGNPSLDE